MLDWVLNTPLFLQLNFTLKLFSSNPAKRSNTLKQCRLLPTNCLGVFDHFVGLALKGSIGKFVVITWLLKAVVQKCSVKKDVLRNFVKFTGKHLLQSLLFNQVTGLRSATLLKKRLWRRCFPVDFTKFLRTPFLIEHLRWLLHDCSESFVIFILESFAKQLVGCQFLWEIFLFLKKVIYIRDF